MLEENTVQVYLCRWTILQLERSSGVFYFISLYSQNLGAEQMLTVNSRGRYEWSPVGSATILLTHQSSDLLVRGDEFLASESPLLGSLSSPDYPTRARGSGAGRLWALPAPPRRGWVPRGRVGPWRLSGHDAWSAGSGRRRRRGGGAPPPQVAGRATSPPAPDSRRAAVPTSCRRAERRAASLRSRT